MNITELRDLQEEELVERLKELTTQLNQFYTLPKEKIEKPRQKSQLRHERARIMTLLNEKKLKNL